MVAQGLVRFGAVVAMAYAMSLTPATAQSYTPEQQQLCTGDAMRLCSDAIPDVNRVTACMVARRALLSPGCKAVFRYEGDTPAATRVIPARVKKPVSIAPRKARAKNKSPKSRG